MKARNKSSAGKKRRTKRDICLERQDNKCAYCECELVDYIGDPDKVMVTLDHVIPRSAGGPLDLNNLVASCGPCNTAKGDMSLEEFLEGREQ